MVVSDQHLIERKDTKYNIEWVKLITPGAWWTVVIVNGRMLLLFHWGWEARVIFGHSSGYGVGGITGFCHMIQTGSR